MYKFQMRELMLALSASGAVIVSAVNADAFVDYCQQNHVKCYVGASEQNVVEVRKGMRPVEPKPKFEPRKKRMAKETEDFLAKWDDNIRFIKEHEDDPIIA